MISPLGLIAKKEAGAYRLIHHLSFPEGESINDGISADDSHVQYQSIGDGRTNQWRRLTASVDPTSSVYMVPGTEEQSESDTSEEQSESDTSASNRWMRLTASVAKQVVSMSACIDDYSGNNVLQVHTWNLQYFGWLQCPQLAPFCR